MEQIDIGGPAMVRASAKNHANVAVVVSPSRYPEVVAALADGGFTLDQRRALAAEAFAHTATYDIAVASWMGSVVAPDSVISVMIFARSPSLRIRYRTTIETPCAARNTNAEAMCA